MKILVVDDNVDMAEALAMNLEYAGHTVITAHDGAEGLFKFRESQFSNTPFDAVVSDWQMPKMDGIEMIQQIRRMAPLVKVVLVSGGGPHVPESIPFLAKPFGRAELLAALGVESK
jgi:DNA-binding response OmpR family regulator